MFEMLIRRWSGDVQWAVKQNSLGLKGGARARNKNLAIIGMWVILKATGLVLSFYLYSVAFTNSRNSSCSIMCVLSRFML